MGAARIRVLKESDQGWSEVASFDPFEGTDIGPDEEGNTYGYQIEYDRPGGGTLVVDCAPTPDPDNPVAPQ